MRRAAPALLFVLLLGCQPGPPAPTVANVKGIWLRDNEEFKNGVSLAGTSTAYEEFSDKGSGYYAVEHSFNDRYESYTITKGSWHAYEGVLTLRYSTRIKIGIKPEKTEAKESLQDVVELKPIRITADRFEYEHPKDGIITLVRGDYPKDVEPKYRHAIGPEFDWIGIDREAYEKSRKASN